jgi:hypothetical protein
MIARIAGQQGDWITFWTLVQDVVAKRCRERGRIDREGEDNRWHPDHLPEFDPLVV